MLMTLVSFSFITIISKELDKEHFMFLWFVRIACERIKCKLSVSRVSHTGSFNIPVLVVFPRQQSQLNSVHTVK